MQEILTDVFPQGNSCQIESDIFLFNFTLSVATDLKITIQASSLIS